MGARSLVVAVVGYSLVIAMGTSFEIQYFGLLSGFGKILCGCTLTIGELSSILALILVSHRHPSSERFEVPIWVLALGAMGFAAMVVGAGAEGASGVVLPAVGSLLQGAQRSTFVLAWFHLFTRMADRDVLLLLIWSHLASACLSFVLACAGVPLPEMASLCLAVMPFFSAALLKTSWKSYSECGQGDTSPSGWTFPVRPVAFVAVFTFVNNFVRSFLPEWDAAMTVLGVVVGSVPILVAVYVSKERPVLPVLREVSLPVLLAGCLCLNLSGGGLVGGILTNAGFICLDVFTFAALCRMSKRYGINPIWFIGTAKAAAFVSSRAGEFCGYAVSSGPGFGSGQTALVLVIAVPALVLAFNLFATRTDIGGTWGVVPNENPSGAEEAGAKLKAPVDVASAVARETALTRREEDVLALLLLERSAPEISRELFVSEATVRTHVQRIYKKLGVHSRSELYEACSQIVDG